MSQPIRPSRFTAPADVRTLIAASDSGVDGPPAYLKTQRAAPVNYQVMSDAELMSAVGAADTGALESLYERHVRGCFGLALKIVRDPDVAEEVVQDVFVKLWTNPLSFSADRGKFSGWLLTLVHNRSVDRLRRAKAGGRGAIVPLDAVNEAGTSLADTLADGSPALDEQAWAQERGHIIRGLLAKLPEQQRQAISMAYFGGLTQREISEQLDEPLGTIKTRTRAGLRQMRKLLGERELLGDLH